ncbi:MAG TPA: hypothetical protein VN891_17410 [Steroidobacteraceae bacterium]|jgi:hypothetical protein|nr:hypothetical protein [Steroidobacteraceae bacterium]
MADRDAAARELIYKRLAQSREELRALLEPPRESNGGREAGMNGLAGFPRSRTMQMLMSSRGLGALGALAGGLLIARPALALRLLRFVPASAVAKMLMAKAVGALKSKPAAQ